MGHGHRKNLNALPPHTQQQPGSKRILSPRETVPEESLRRTHRSPVVETELLNDSLHLIYLLWVRHDFLGKGHLPLIVRVGQEDELEA